MEKKILFVDDDADIRNLTALGLEQSGQYRCEVASDHAEAIQILNNGWSPQVAIVDVMMPSSLEAGLNLIEDIRKNPNWKLISVIVISARSESDTILKALRLGAIDYLIKPYGLKELLECIERGFQLYEVQTSQEESVTLPTVNAPPQETTTDNRLRKLHVDVMQMSLLYWEVTTSKTKVELAEMSGIWNSYIDSKGTYRTKTLDRYLNENTLPKRPHTHQVLQTAYYVIKNCPLEERLLNQLQASLKELETIHRGQS